MDDKTALTAVLRKFTVSEIEVKAKGLTISREPILRLSLELTGPQVPAVHEALEGTTGRSFIVVFHRDPTATEDEVPEQTVHPDQKSLED